MTKECTVTITKEVNNKIIGEMESYWVGAQLLTAVALFPGMKIIRYDLTQSGIGQYDHEVMYAGTFEQLHELVRYFNDRREEWITSAVGYEDEEGFVFVNEVGTEERA